MGTRRYTERDVVKILDLRAQGLSLSEIEPLTPMTKKLIIKILKGGAYSDYTGRGRKHRSLFLRARAVKNRPGPRGYALTDDQVRDAREMFYDGWSQVRISEELGTTEPVISMLLSGQTYRDVR